VGANFYRDRSVTDTWVVSGLHCTFW